MWVRRLCLSYFLWCSLKLEGPVVNTLKCRLLIDVNSLLGVYMHEERCMNAAAVSRNCSPRAGFTVVKRQPQFSAVVIVVVHLLFAKIPPTCQVFFLGGEKIHLTLFAPWRLCGFVCQFYEAVRSMRNDIPFSCMYVKHTCGNEPELELATKQRLSFKALLHPFIQDTLFLMY